MKKKLLSFVLSASMVVGLVGCASMGKETTSEEINENSAVAITTDNELTVWCWDPAFNIYAMEEAAKVYQENNPDFVLNVVETPWADVQTKLTTAATSGDLSTLPDILLMQDNAFQKNVIVYPDAFVDLTGSKISYDDFGQSKVAYSTVDGKNYGVPFDNGTVVNCMRIDVLEEAGFTIDDFTDITWSEYIEKGKIVLEKTGKPLLSMQAGESDLIMMMLQSSGSSLFTDDGQPNLKDNEALKEVVKVYKELVDSGVMIQVNDWDQYISTLTNSTVASTINGCWILASIQTAEDQSGLWEVTNMPKFESVEGATNYSNNGGSSWAITSNCNNVDLAIDFLSSTFAGSVDFYSNILSSSGAMATYLPAGDAPIYDEESVFFNNQKIYSSILDFASKVPSNNTGVYYYEARDAVAVAITNVIAGADIDSELQAAEDTVNFMMGQ